MTVNLCTMYVTGKTLDLLGSILFDIEAAVVDSCLSWTKSCIYPPTMLEKEIFTYGFAARMMLHMKVIVQFDGRKTCSTPLIILRKQIETEH